MDILPISLVGFGFLSGLRHAFDIDHVAAVSTMTSNQKSIKKSSLLGLFWGFGHTIALIFVGLFVLLLKITIAEKLVLSLEFIVGVMLVALGINTILTIKKNKIHMHKHKHGNMTHIHVHSHSIKKSHNHMHYSLLIGLIHGLAGSAALTLLVMATTNSVLLGLFYILIFGSGSIVGMILVSSMVSVPFYLIPNKLEKIQKILQGSIGLISTIIGFIVMHNIIMIF